MVLLVLDLPAPARGRPYLLQQLYLALRSLQYKCVPERHFTTQRLQDFHPLVHRSVERRKAYKSNIFNTISTFSIQFPESLSPLALVRGRRGDGWASSSSSRGREALKLTNNPAQGLLSAFRFIQFEILTKVPLFPVDYSMYGWYV